MAAITAGLIESQHYLRQPLDFQFSQKALDRYFEVLDPDRLYFVQSDLEEFRSKYAINFAARLKSGDLSPVEEIHGRYKGRVQNFCDVALGLSGGEWKFETPWTIDLTRDHANWPADSSEAHSEWVAQVGADLLEFKLEGLPSDRAAVQLRKRLENLRKSVLQDGPRKPLASALLALARACDAHSDYLTQEELEDTENELRLTRIGIGVTLDPDPAGLRVAGLLPGGPAQRDGRLKVNDRIVAVAEGGGNFRELDGVPFAQAIALLRGQKGSTVRLRVAPARAADPAQRTVLALRREEMRSREGEAYSKIVECARTEGGSLRLGWLVVPGFYGDDMNPLGSRASSVSRDVSTLLRRLIGEHVDGVVLDLRGNLGGLLDEAIELGGLFCGQVPIAAVRSPGEDLEVLAPSQLKSKKALYEGPLVVLSDRGSASASELVAAALQDHGRAVLVGGEQTFGKGSIQTTIPLSEYFKTRERPPVGGLALTIGKFYRVNGQSTQLVGVRPDIVLPSTLDVPREGEGALTDPLPHDSIAPVSVDMEGRMSFRMLDSLRTLSAKRVGMSSEFAAITFERDRIRRERQENRLSLEEKKRREALEEAHKIYAERETAINAPQIGARYARLLLEDVKSKRLKLENNDPLCARDPESVTIEREVLQVLLDLIALQKP